MTITADLSALTTDIAAVADANTKTALTAVVTVLNDLVAQQNLDSAAIASYNLLRNETGGLMPAPLNQAPTAGVAELDLATYVTIPGRVSAASTQNLPLLDFSVASYTLTAATHAVAYNDQVTVAGGVSQSQGFTITVVDPTLLPPGITVSTTGLVSGTPTTAGSYFFALTVTDTAGNAVSRAFALVVN